MSVFVKGNSVYGFDIFIIHLRIRVVQSHYITVMSNHKQNYLLQTTTKTTTNNKNLQSVSVPSENFKLVNFYHHTDYVRQITKQM